jgi:hypothetical protein
MNMTELIQAIRNKHGGLANASDAQIMIIAAALSPEAKQEYLLKKEKKEKGKESKHDSN